MKTGWFPRLFAAVPAQLLAFLPHWQHLRPPPQCILPQLPGMELAASHRLPCSSSAPAGDGTRTQRSPRAGFAERQPDSSLSPVSNLTSDCERSMVTSPAIRALPLTSVACFVEICSSHCRVHQQHGLSPLHPRPARLLLPQLLRGTEPTAFQ